MPFFFEHLQQGLITLEPERLSAAALILTSEMSATTPHNNRSSLLISVQSSVGSLHVFMDIMSIIIMGSMLPPIIIIISIMLLMSPSEPPDRSSIIIIGSIVGAGGVIGGGIGGGTPCPVTLETTHITTAKRENVLIYDMMVDTVIVKTLL